MDAVARLSARLDDWRDAPAALPPDASAATALLEAAEEALAGGGSAPRALWEDYLALTRRPRFLTALGNDDARRRWAETTFRVIDGIGFTLGDLLRQRAAEHPDRLLLQEAAEAGGGGWTYAQVLREVRATAALFLAAGPRPALPPEAVPATDGPRVALLCANSVAAACCDLACLTHDILVTPLSVQMSVAELTWVFDRLAVTVAVCDHADRLDLLLAVRAQTARPFTVFTLFEGTDAPAAAARRAPCGRTIWP